MDLMLGKFYWIDKMQTNGCESPIIKEHVTFSMFVLRMCTRVVDWNHSFFTGSIPSFNGYAEGIAAINHFIRVWPFKFTVGSTLPSLYLLHVFRIACLLLINFEKIVEEKRNHNNNLTRF